MAASLAQQKTIQIKRLGQNGYPSFLVCFYKNAKRKQNFNKSMLLLRKQTRGGGQIHVSTISRGGRSGAEQSRVPICVKTAMKR